MLPTLFPRLGFNSWFGCWYKWEPAEQVKGWILSYSMKSLDIRYVDMFIKQRHKIDLQYNDLMQDVLDLWPLTWWLDGWRYRSYNMKCLQSRLNCIILLIVAEFLYKILINRLFNVLKTCFFAKLPITKILNAIVHVPHKSENIIAKLNISNTQMMFQTCFCT